MKIKKCSCEHVITTKDLVVIGRTDEPHARCLWFNCPKCQSTLIVKGKPKCDSKTRVREIA